MTCPICSEPAKRRVLEEIETEVEKDYGKAGFFSGDEDVMVKYTRVVTYECSHGHQWKV